MKSKSYSGPDAPLIRIYEEKFKDGKSALKYREKAVKGSKQDKLTIVKEKNVDAVAQIEIQCVVQTDASSDVSEGSSSEGKNHMESAALRAA